MAARSAGVSEYKMEDSKLLPVADSALSACPSDDQA